MIVVKKTGQFRPRDMDVSCENPSPVPSVAREFNNRDRVGSFACAGSSRVVRRTSSFMSSFRAGMQHSNAPRSPPPPPPEGAPAPRPSTPPPFRLKLVGCALVPYTGAARLSARVTCLITGSLSLSPFVPDIPTAGAPFIASSSSSAFVHIVRPPCFVGDPGVRETPGYSGPPSWSSSTPTCNKRAEACCFCGVVSAIASLLTHTPAAPRGGQWSEARSPSQGDRRTSDTIREAEFGRDVDRTHCTSLTETAVSIASGRTRASIEG